MPPDNDLQMFIQHSLQEIAGQIGQPISEAIAYRIYEEAIALLSHLSYAPVTLGRVAGLLLVYELQEVEPDEVDWFKNQVQQCRDGEDVEELIESLSRIDTL